MHEKPAKSITQSLGLPKVSRGSDQSEMRKSGNVLSPKKKRPRSFAPLAESAFSGPELSKFQKFVGKSDEQCDALSNAIDLWDNIPRYSISRMYMKKMRTQEGFLEVQSIPFRHRGVEYVAVLYPARICDGAGGRVSYFPSAREELLEHALRKLAGEQFAGFFDQTTFRSGVRFSLYRLRTELEMQGHSLRYDELIEGLNILSLSAIEIVTKADNGGAGFVRAGYLSALGGVTRCDYDADRTLRWQAEFHPLVTHSIQNLAYRQFNYLRYMKCTGQLARWLLCQLVLKYVQASLIDKFDMRFSTIRRDSALLFRYERTRDAVAALNEAWDELKEIGVLGSIHKTVQFGLRNKIEDVIYSVMATREFTGEQKAANWRLREGKENCEPPSAPQPDGGKNARSTAAARALPDYLLKGNRSRFGS